MKLLIVESPGKIKKIRSFLGSGWQVKASVGHVRDLPERVLGVVVEGDRVRMDYETSPSKKKTVDEIRRYSNQASEIYLAMDMDREGEAIAWHVGMLLGEQNWSKIRRITFTEITETAVKKAMGLPRRVDKDLVMAQQARRAVDRLVGFKVSPMVRAAGKGATSAGRVQSVAVRQVVEREREIRDFKPQDYWKIRALLAVNEEEEAPTFWADLMKLDSKDLVSTVEDEKKQHAICTEEEAQKLIEEFKAGAWKVLKQESKTQSKKPFPPYVTSTLQQAASVRLKWGPKKTMQIAQGLYEKGIITYMRTDAPAISAEAVAMARRHIEGAFPKEYLPAKAPKYKAKGGNAQEAHECIRPVKVSLTPELTGDMDWESRALYELIWKQFVACQMAPAKFHVVTIDVENGRGLFRAKGRRIIFDGWTRLTGSASESTKDKEGGDKDEEDEGSLLLPEVENGQSLAEKEMQETKHKTKPPPRYTEATLIRFLEKKGIGRPSTYAAIMDNIKRRGYLKEQKRMIYAQGVGEDLVDLLMGSFGKSWMDYSFTAQMEENLDKIASGQVNWHLLVARFNSLLDSVEGVRLRSPPQATDKKCEKCGKPLVIREGKYGRFYACTGFPKCKNTHPLTS